MILGAMFFLIVSIGFVSADRFGYNYLDDAISKARTFLRLTDTPVSYSGQAGNCVVVGAGENALEFGSCGAAGSGNPFDQSLNTTDNVQFAETNVTGWFNGLFNWTTLNNWLTFTGSSLSFNDTRLNESISSYTGNLSGGVSDYYVNTTGDTMTGDLNMVGGNITLNNTELKDVINGSRIYLDSGVWVVEA